ncbi:MAG TPA: ABC transporter permease, partial [Clostridiales bacterium]|nr:ABC transporter permease [Clostridiales bacterium]
MDKNKFVFIEQTGEGSEAIRPSLTYWQDAWRRLKKNKLSMIGIFVVFLIIGFGFVGPYLTPYSYSDQVNKYKNLPPMLDLYEIDGHYFHL